MDPEAATELARKGVTLLLLDVPNHTVLGVDTQVGTHTSSHTAEGRDFPSPGIDSSI
jgi:hypothetical protein